MSSQRLEAHFTLVHVKTMRALTTHRNEFTAPRVTKRFEISHVKGLLVRSCIELSYVMLCSVKFVFPMLNPLKYTVNKEQMLKVNSDHSYTSRS